MAIDRGIPPLLHGGDLAPMALYVAGFAAAVGIQAVASRGFIYSMGKLGETVVLELRQRLFLHFQRLPVAFHEHYTSGRVISRQVSDIDSISDLFDDGLDALVSAALSLVLVGAGMLLLDWPLALVVLAGFVPLVWLTIWFRRESALAYRRTRETIAQVIVHFVETFGGIRAVQAFRREQRNEEIFGQLQRAATRRPACARPGCWRCTRPGITLVGNVATGVVLCYGGLRVIDGDIKVGVLATFLLYLGRFFDPLQDLSQFYNSFQSAAASLEKISGVLDEPPRCRSPRTRCRCPPRQAAARPGGPVRGGAVRLPGRRGAARAGPDHPGRADRGPGRARPGAGQDHHGPAAGPLLRPGPGQGPAGRRRPAGRCRPGAAPGSRPGHPGELPVHRVRGRQHPARPARRRTGRRSRQRPGPSARTRFISALPGGYDADVGKRGGRLSAGQRQLISFARAFLAAPAVLVLDEATSLLDIPSERLVQAALRTILAGRTAMIIAHRLSTVEIADRVLVLSGGRVVEDGPPERLLAGDGEYSALHADWRDSLA